MSYRLNNFVPIYLGYSDYNLKNVYIETKRKVYGKKVYKFYNKRLLEGMYKFGFYKDIINGELAVVDSGIKKVQIVQDEISGRDSDINLSWVFATKHLESQNDVFGYEYKSIYNLKLLCLALLRFENRNKILRGKAKVLNLKPSLRLGLTRRGLSLSSLVLRKKLFTKSLLFKLLRFWHSGKIRASSLRFFSFFVFKVRVRLKKLILLYFYYKLRYIKLFEYLFLPARVFVNDTNTRVFRFVKMPPVWMLKRFGLGTRKKIVKGLFWTSYLNYACGLWGTSKITSVKKVNADNKLIEGLGTNWDKRRSILCSSHAFVPFVKFFNLFYRNRKFHKRQKHRYSISFVVAFSFLFNQLSLRYTKKHVFFAKLFLDFMHFNLKGSNLSNKKLVYQSILFFVSLGLQFRKGIGTLFSCFGFFDIYRHLLILPGKMVDVFLYNERLFLYNVELKYSVDAFNSYCVPLLKKYFNKFSNKLMNRTKHYLWKTSRRVWRWNKRYSWSWRKRVLFKRVKKRSIRRKLYFSWIFKYFSARIVKRYSGGISRLMFKNVKKMRKRKINRINKMKTKMGKFNVKITQTGKPYNKYSGRKDQFLGKRWPDKRVNKRERNLDVNIQTKNKKQDATIR